MRRRRGQWRPTSGFYPMAWVRVPIDALISPGNAGGGADMAISRNDAHQAATAALQSLSKWHDEVVAANERCLADVLDQTAAAARAVGWPDHVINATRDQLLKASQLQTRRSTSSRLSGRSSSSLRPPLCLLREASWTRRHASRAPAIPAQCRKCSGSAGSHLRLCFSGCRPPKCGSGTGCRRCRFGRMLSRSGPTRKNGAPSGSRPTVRH